MDGRKDIKEFSKEKEKPRWDISEILKGWSEVVIIHDGCEYHLRVTKHNKLILTK